MAAAVPVRPAVRRRRGPIVGARAAGPAAAAGTRPRPLQLSAARAAGARPPHRRRPRPSAPRTPTFSEDELATRRRGGAPSGPCRGRSGGAGRAGGEPGAPPGRGAGGDRGAAGGQPGRRSSACSRRAPAPAASSRSRSRRALVAEALALQPLADIEAMLRRARGPARGPALARGRACRRRWPQPARRRCARPPRRPAIAASSGCVPDAGLGPGDARLAWQDGAAERDLARLEAEAAALVEAWLPDAQRGAAAAGATRSRRSGGEPSDERRDRASSRSTS